MNKINDFLCAKIGGIWCYWPTSRSIGVFLGALAIFLIIVLSWLLRKKKRDKD